MLGSLLPTVQSATAAGAPGGGTTGLDSGEVLVLEEFASMLLAGSGGSGDGGADSDGERRICR